MSYPILYSSTETNFDHNGFGILSDCDFCEVVEEANGIFELSMTYPVDGMHFENIGDRSLLKVKIDQYRNPQIFRVYSITKSMPMIASIRAKHISYDLTGIPVQPFTAEDAESAIQGLSENTVVSCPFSFWTNKEDVAHLSVEVPTSVRSVLGGIENNILSVYGGDLEFDNFTVKLHNSRGANRGVSIRYGKNLTSLTQEQNCSNVITGIYPFWKNFVEPFELVELPEKIMYADGNYNFVRITPIDFSDEFDSKPTEEELRKKAEEYISSHNIGIPVVSFAISFVQLNRSEEYKDLNILEQVMLFDDVNVEFPAMGVSATAKVVRMTHDVVGEKVKSIVLGSVRANIADTIVEQIKEVEKKPSKSFLEIAVDGLTKAILGARGGSVRLLDTNDDGEPDTLYIADDPDPAKAVKVWRFNYEGWGASDTGYAGPFKMGASLESGIVAEFITSGLINSERINGSTLEITEGAKIAGWDVGKNSIFNTESEIGNGTFISTGTEESFSIGGSSSVPDWVFGAGGKFGVRKNGSLYASNANISGTVNASLGSIGDWSIEKISGSTSTITELVGRYNGNVVRLSPIGLTSNYTRPDGTGGAVTMGWEGVMERLMSIPVQSE